MATVLYSLKCTGKFVQKQSNNQLRGAVFRIKQLDLNFWAPQKTPPGGLSKNISIISRTIIYISILQTSLLVTLINPYANDVITRR